MQCCANLSSTAKVTEFYTYIIFFNILSIMDIAHCAAQEDLAIYPF